MSRKTTLTVALMTGLAVAMACGISRATAQDSRAQSWSEVKCARYKKAWVNALAGRGMKGLSQEFIARHESFLDSGCTAKAEVCPRSAEELDLANILTILAMNAGTASTFPHFACPQ